MSMPSAREGALVLYKSQPAKVVSVADKIELSLADGSSKKVPTTLNAEKRNVTGRKCATVYR